MSEYLSSRKRNLNIGIRSYTENKLVLDVIGKTNITGSTSLASAGGITTTGGDLYVGGTIHLKDITLTPGTIETNYLKVSVASTLGIASASSLTVSGITTIGQVTINPSGIITSTNPGVTTVTYYGDGSKLFGVKAFSVVNQELTSNPVYITFASNIGVSSIGISTEQLVFIPSTGSVGIGTTTPKAKLDISGNVNVSGIITATTFVGNLTGTATTATNVIGGIGSLSSLTVSGITTVGFLTASNINVSGVVTATTFYGNLTGGTAGIATYATSSGVSTSVIGGIGSLSSLTVSGITTLGTVKISSGIITATSGIVTYYGDGYNLSRTKQSYQLNGTTVGTATTLNIIGAGSSSVLLNDVLNLTISNTIRTVNTYTATLNQTTFAATYNLGFVDVYFNGSKLSSDQYTATDGLNIILETGASLGDIVDIIGYTTYKVVGTQTILSDTLSSTSGITTSYTGLADQGSSQSASVWTIRRSIFTSAGILSSSGSALNVQWINRYSVTYT
jgi:hypothetical protein